MDTYLPLLLSSEAPPHRRQVSRDLLVVAAVTVGMFLFSVVFELREWLTEVTRPLEPYQIDELPLTLAAAALSLTWFAWRRWRQSQWELQLRVAAQRALTEALAENRLLSQKYLLVQEEERRNLAREMHDELGQCLNAVKLDAVAICEASKGALPQIESSARSIVELSNHVYDVVRSMMQRLRPAALDVLGLRDAVGELVNQWRRRNSNVACGFESEGDLSGLGELINITVYRLVQECLTNVAKHAAASRVDVGLARTDALEVRVTVHDNGRGMHLHAKRSGLGLVGLRERVEALHGRLELTAAPGAGMRVTATLPLPSNG
jgi:two-component system, NarL family, sensor histidine kinase UhpB